MKKIIGGKVYDTETAKARAEYENTPYRSSYDWYKETLYQKKTGEFFLHGEGHANSKYACYVTRSERAPGEKILPLTYSEAQKWAEEHLDGDEYEEIFGEITEDETRCSLNLSVSSAAVDKLKRAAAQAGKSVSEVIEGFVKTL